MKFYFFKFISLPVFILMFIGNVFSQNKPQQNSPAANAAVTGKVIDKKTGQAVEYANILVYKTKDSVMAGGGLSGSGGSFKIDKLSYGKYYIRVNFIGFSPVIIGDINLTPEKPLYDAGKILLSSVSTSLDGVTITGERDQIEYNLDKKVINVDKNVLTSGGTAVDVMQTIPSVSVDIDGNISMRGSANVTIFIDGKPSQLTSLDQMPASMIDKVELITNPSARFDPDGMSGIINIITKKKKEPGYNGMVSANIGTGDKYNGSINLNYRLKRVNLYTSIDGRWFAMQGTTLLEREILQNDTANYYYQHADFTRQGRFFNFKLGADFDLSETSTLSLYGVYNLRKFNTGDLADYTDYNYRNELTRYYQIDRFSGSNGGGYEINLDYRKTFKNKGQELTASAFYSDSDRDNDGSIDTKWYNLDLTPSSDPVTQQKTTNDSKDKRFTGQIDYIHPFGKWGRIETGYKGSYKINDMIYVMEDYDVNSTEWIRDTVTSNDFLFTEQLHSVYFIYAIGVKNFKFQLGGRLEQALTNSEQKTINVSYKNNYLNFFPTAHVKYEFSERNALMLSYSRRVNRPGSRTLNPFVNTEDPMNLTAGNPYLKPEFTNAFELSHLIDFKSTSIGTTLFYRETDNIIGNVMTLLDSGVTYTTYQNLDRESSYGAELVLSQKIFKWWKMNGSFSFFGLKYKGDGQVEIYNDYNYSWNAKVFSTMTFWKSFDVQLSFYYSSPVISTQGKENMRFTTGGGIGRQKANFYFDAGLKKDFFKGKLSLSLRMSDVLKTIQFDLQTQGSNFNSTLSRTRESRVVYFGISYKINGGLKQKKRKAEDNNIDFEY